MLEDINIGDQRLFSNEAMDMGVRYDAVANEGTELLRHVVIANSSSNGNSSLVNNSVLVNRVSDPGVVLLQGIDQRVSQVVDVEASDRTRGLDY